MASQGLLLDLPAATTIPQAPLPTRPNLTPDFARFGTWGPEIRVVRDGAIGKCARWIATSGLWHLDPQSRWQQCQEANPHWFRTYRVARLDAPSFFLPAGEVVFRVEVNPAQIPEAPPEGVLMRHVEALMAFPRATTFLLQPVFVNDPVPRLYSAGDLRQEALGDQREALRIARQWGWAFRAAAWGRRKGRQGVEHAKRVALRMATRLLESLASDVAAQLPSRREIDPALFWATHRTLTRLHQRAEENGWEADVARFREALGRLTEIDPVLCFELPERPGELWFESHWFEGIDGRRYVHY